MVMGKRYAQPGMAQGRAILADLAVHPATARHVSGKIARHLIRDTPPPAVIEAMCQAWARTDGDLAAVYTALIRHPAAWDAQARKFKTPDDYLVSALRAGGALDDRRPQALATLLGRMGSRPSPRARPPASRTTRRSGAARTPCGSACRARRRWPRPCLRNSSIRCAPRRPSSPTRSTPTP